MCLRFFIERASQLLDSNGILALILPSTILNKGGIFTKTREILLRDFRIIALVELGNSAFFKTGTNTVILFALRKDRVPTTQAEKFNDFYEKLINNQFTEAQDTYRDFTEFFNAYCEFREIDKESLCNLFSGKEGNLEQRLDDELRAYKQALQKAKSEYDKKSQRYKENNEFIAGLQEATDLTDPVEGVNAVTPWIKQAAGFVVQVVFYAVTVLLAVRVVLDLAYIGLPFTRSFLGNGYSGAAAAQGQPGMGGPGMGMGGPGMGMGGYGMNRMGMGGMGGYGMNRMGMGGYGAGGNPNQTGQMMGKIQWVSNAALIAAEQEGQMTPDGKHTGPLKSYMKNMIVVLVLVPVLLVLAATGALTQLGLTIGEILVDTIAMVGDMI